MVYEYQELRQKVRDVWLAKCISGNIGFNLECYKEILDFKHIEDFAPEDMKPNDDLDIQLAWVDLLLERGPEIEAGELLEKFIECSEFDFSEYGYAKRNYKRGILPPLSGRYNNYFAECMGCPIRAEVWALISCGNVGRAMELAAKDGMIDHGEVSILAEQWIAAMEALAFAGRGMLSVIVGGLSLLPQESPLVKAVRGVINAYRDGEAWRTVIENVHREYGSGDGTYVVVNMAIMTAGLLYGGDDFDRVMTLTLNGGYDTDCTCATAGVLFVMVYGLEKIEKKWVALADGKIVTSTKNLKHSLGNFDELADATMKIILYGVESGWNGEVQITGAEHVERLAISARRSSVAFETQYPDGVELKEGEVKRAVVKIFRRGSKASECDVRSIIPDSLQFVSFPPERVALNEKGCGELCFSVRLKKNLKVVPDSNVLSFTVTVGGETAEHKVGFVGAQIFRLSAAFADGFDLRGKENLDALPQDAVRTWGGKKFLFHMDCNEYTNNWVRFDHEYLAERWTEEYFDESFAKFRPCATEEDFLRIDKTCSFKGPCVVYALQKLYRPEEEKVELHIGSSDPYKLWINGELIAFQQENWYFSPYNQRPRVKLKKGVNRIAVKLLRTGKTQEWAYVLRKYPFNHVGCIATDGKYLVE